MSNGLRLSGEELPRASGLPEHAMQEISQPLDSRPSNRRTRRRLHDSGSYGDALIADVNPRPGNELRDLVSGLPTERAPQPTDAHGSTAPFFDSTPLTISGRDGNE